MYINNYLLVPLCVTGQAIICLDLRHRMGAHKPRKGRLVRKHRNPGATLAVPRAIFSRGAAGSAPSAVFVAYNMSRADNRSKCRNTVSGVSGSTGRGGGGGIRGGVAGSICGVASREKCAAPGPCESRTVSEDGGIAGAAGAESGQKGA